MTRLLLRVSQSFIGLLVMSSGGGMLSELTGAPGLMPCCPQCKNSETTKYQNVFWQECRFGFYLVFQQLLACSMMLLVKKPYHQSTKVPDRVAVQPWLLYSGGGLLQNLYRHLKTPSTTVSYTSSSSDATSEMTFSSPIWHNACRSRGL